jgi:hypothetical protein
MIFVIDVFRPLARSAMPSFVSAKALNDIPLVAIGLMCEGFAL